MKEANLIAEEFIKRIDVEEEPEIWEVETGHIPRFAQANGDPNPLWQDEDDARKTRYGEIIAPPFFLVDAGLVKLVDKLVQMCPHWANINGGTELECYRPMKVGDTIQTVAKLSEVKKREGKSDSMLFLPVEVTYTNHNKELVARCRTTFIRR